MGSSKLYVDIVMDSYRNQKKMSNLTIFNKIQMRNELRIFSRYGG